LMIIVLLLKSGCCSIMVNGEVVGDLSEASSFGDIALMYNSPRTATITATTHCTLWSLDRVFFRQAMVTSSSNQIVQLSQFLSKIKLFESLGVQSLSQLARSLTKQSYEDGTYIIRQGEIGEEFFVIFKGRVKVTSTGDDGEEKFLIGLSEGNVFGERAIIKKEPRAANVVAVGPVECYYLDSANFQLMLGQIVDKMNLMNEFRLLRSSPVLNSVSDHWLKKTMQSYSKQTMFEHQRLVCDSNGILAILDGRVETSNGTVYGPGAVIGDLANGAEASGAITVVSFEAVVAVLNRKQLQDNVGKSDTDGEENADVDNADDGIEGGIDTSRGQGDRETDNELVNSIVQAATADPSLDAEMRRTSMRRKATATARRESVKGLTVHSIGEVSILRTLGQGTFGTVYLCQHGAGSRLLAMKCLDKKAVVESSQHQYLVRELIALQNFHHVFIAEYYGLILTPSKVIFMLEYVPGGELWDMLYADSASSIGVSRGPFGGLSMLSAANFSAMVMLMLEHIHSHGYSYRDLKPENLLVATNGYLKLIDFGFAKPIPFYNRSKQVQYRTFTLCGTPEYMAPEVVLTQGHDKSADYWAFGVLIYELLCRHTPFEGRNQQRTFEKIVHSSKHLTFSAGFDPHCKSLIRRLLHHNPALRLGALQNGFDDIRSHAFFAMQNVDFEKLVTQEVEMERCPTVKDVQGQNFEHFDVDKEFYGPMETDYSSFFISLLSVENGDEFSTEL
jgi:serine/threonine protein kinase/CRP-like cAMP-binding protein